MEGSIIYDRDSYYRSLDRAIKQHTHFDLYKDRIDALEHKVKVLDAENKSLKRYFKVDKLNQMTGEWE